MAAAAPSVPSAILAGAIRRCSSVGRAPRQEVCRWFESNRLHQIQCSCEVQAERASRDRAQEGSRNVYLSGLTASSRHAAVTAGKDRHPPHADVAQSVRAPRRVDAVGSSPTVCTIGVTSCLAAARSVSLRKWSFLCAVRKRQDEQYLLGWHRPCKDERMRPTYRRRAEKFRGWFGCRCVRQRSEACHRTVCGSGVVAAAFGQGRCVGQ